MNVITTAARRILHRKPSQPAWPVAARDGYKSMIFSLDDQRPGPSRRLLDLSMQVVQTILDGKVDLSNLTARPNVPDWFNLWPGEHYQLLAALMQVLRPKRVIEIGTFTGLSSLAMKKYLPEEGRIITFDVNAWHSVEGTFLTPADFADERLEQRLADLGDTVAFSRHRKALEEADFFFIDGPKDNVFEYRFIEHLRTLRFEKPPVLLFDDTRLWSMLRFWRLLDLPKLDLTSFGSWSGTGLAEMPGKPSAIE